MRHFIKTMLWTLGFLSLQSTAVNAQSLKDLWNNVVKGSGQNSQKGTSLSNLNNTEIVGALKQALELGAKNASGQLSATNGFFGNALVKVVLPDEVKQAESLLRQFGMGNIVDQTILTMNRAAEDAAGKAVPIFVNAVTTMSIQDGMQILTGGNNAATNYLKSKTTASLTEAFRPVIQQSLGKFNVTAYWNQLFSAYNNLPLVNKKVNTDLTAYVTEKTLNGLFLTIAQEENKIRENPSARATDLLKKVFGAK